MKLIEIKKKYEATLRMSCEYCLTRSFSDKEILESVWGEMSDSLYGEIADAICEASGGSIRDFSEADMSRIATIDWRSVRVDTDTMAKESDPDMVAFIIPFTIDLDQFKK